MKNQNHRIRRTLATLTVAVLAVGAASCIEGDEPITVEIPGGELFERYVALGNSLTAGFQSGGINVETQQDAFPVLLAEKAGASFGIPALAMPGCPPLLVGPLTTQRTSAEPCALRRAVLPDVVQNLAVPGAATGDLMDPLGTGTLLNTLILGGRTQLQAMQDADPSLVSVWIGNNDALGAALTGNPQALTPLATFQGQYDEIVAAIQATDAQDAILIGAANAMAAAPALQPGAYFWAIAQNPPPGLPPLSVNNNCAPFDLAGNPNPLAFRFISLIGVANAIGAGENPVVIDCLNGVEINGAYTPDYLLDEADQQAIATRVGAFNAYIEQQADANGWMYIDASAFFNPGLQDPNQIRKCQALASATDAASFVAAVMSSCPVDLDPGTAATFFGSWFSFDGIHPSSVGHEAIANTIAGQINAVHGLNLPTN